MSHPLRFPGLARTLPALLALAAGALPVAAAPARTPDPSAPAYVDLNRVLTEYRKTNAFARHQQKLRDQANLFRQEMELLAQVRHCTEAERQEALAIRAKPNPSAREQARLAELIRKSEAVESEFTALSQKANATPAETQRLQELSRIQSEAKRFLAQEEMTRREKLQELETQLMAEVEDELLKLVEKLAREQKLPVIYERRAVLFGGVDLTDQLVKKLPK